MAQASPVIAIVQPDSMQYDRSDPHGFYCQPEEHNASNGEFLTFFSVHRVWF